MHTSETQRRERPTRQESRTPDDTSLVRDQRLAGLVWALALGAGRMPLFP